MTSSKKRKKAKPIIKKTFSSKSDSRHPIFSTDWEGTLRRHRKSINKEAMLNQVFQRTAKDIQVHQPAYGADAKGGQVVQGVALDAGNSPGFNNNFNRFSQSILSDAQFSWFASQSFIGYQMLATLSQSWLIDKACTMPAEDAIRQGYELTIDDGKNTDAKLIAKIRKTDRKYQVNKNLVQFVRMGRIFGIRIVMFDIETEDPLDYYYKPFNLDGVKPGSYRGIIQVDPYWTAPQLDGESASNPASRHFYEPTWWRMPNGLLVHRSHLVIMVTGEVPDVLKPTYFYGGVSIPQKIYERIYAAERTANEAPKLALTKRTDIIKTDLTKALAKQAAFEQRIQQTAEMRDNYGVQVLGKDDEYDRKDTTLNDLDMVIMTQYQLVASIANVPATKLLCTSPKGFNATGEFEEASYHEELENIQTNYMEVLLLRHYALVIKSEIPGDQIDPEAINIEWGTLDTMTAEEQANVNEIKSRTGKNYIESGAINAAEERQRLITDPASGYTGLGEINLEDEEDFDDEESEDAET